MIFSVLMTGDHSHCLLIFRDNKDAGGSLKPANQDLPVKENEVDGYKGLRQPILFRRKKTLFGKKIGIQGTEKKADINKNRGNDALFSY